MTLIILVKLDYQFSSSWLNLLDFLRLPRVSHFRQKKATSL